MNLLLDTHIFLWYISGDKRLPNKYKKEIKKLNNNVYLSVVSFWEIIIKYEIGKLNLPQSPHLYIPIQRKRHLIESLNLDEESLFHLINLPKFHRDPFDRILVCQALEHKLILVTIDDTLKQYPVQTLD